MALSTVATLAAGKSAFRRLQAPLNEPPLQSDVNHGHGTWGGPGSGAQRVTAASQGLIVSAEPNKANFTSTCTAGLALLMDRVSRTHASAHRRGGAGTWASSGAGRGGWASDAAPRQPLFQRYGSGEHGASLRTGPATASGQAGTRRPRPDGVVSWTAADGSLAVREVMVTRHQRSPGVQLVGPGDQRMPVLGDRFVPQHLLGVGSFSQLLRARDVYTGTDVAIKVVNARFTGVGCQEYMQLRRLQPSHGEEAVPIVRLITRCTFHGHLCIVLELLADTLAHRFLRPPSHTAVDRGASPGAGPHVLGMLGGSHPSSSPTPGVPLPTATLASHASGAPPTMLRKMAFQLIVMLAYLRDKHTIHADIKPENIMLASRAPVVDSLDAGAGAAGWSKPGGGHGSGSAALRLADWGNSITLDMVSLYLDDYEIQPLGYRAPEVLLGLPSFGCGIDVWSVGCVIAELWCGRRLFAANSRGAVVRRIVSVLGPLPANVYAAGKYSSRLRDAIGSGPPETGGGAQQWQDAPWSRRKVLAQLTAVLNCADVALLDLLQRLLTLDPSRRISAAEALSHAYFAPLLPVSILQAARASVAAAQPPVRGGLSGRARASGPTHRPAAAESRSHAQAAPSVLPASAGVAKDVDDAQDDDLQAVIAAAQRTVAAARRRQQMVTAARAPKPDPSNEDVHSQPTDAAGGSQPQVVAGTSRANAPPPSKVAEPRQAVTSDSSQREYDRELAKVVAEAKRAVAAARARYNRRLAARAGQALAEAVTDDAACDAQGGASGVAGSTAVAPITLPPVIRGGSAAAVAPPRAAPHVTGTAGSGGTGSTSSTRGASAAAATPAGDAGYAAVVAEAQRAVAAARARRRALAPASAPQQSPPTADEQPARVGATLTAVPSRQRTTTPRKRHRPAGAPAVVVGDDVTDSDDGGDDVGDSASDTSDSVVVAARKKRRRRQEGGGGGGRAGAGGGTDASPTRVALKRPSAGNEQAAPSAPGSALSFMDVLRRQRLQVASTAKAAAVHNAE